MTSGTKSLDWRMVSIVTLLCVASRTLYGVLGLQFDATTFPHYMQFIDQELLTHRLLESIWYYHANPPLLNLFVGIGLKLFGAGAGATIFFAVAFHLLGLAMALAVYALTLRLSGSRAAAWIATAALVFSPSFVLYENWLMYSFPAAALLTISAACLYRYVRTGATRWASAFFWVLAVLLLTRSLFHLAWLVMVAGLLTAALWRQRRQVLLAAALPLLVVGLWYGKNYYLFGAFSSSTWFGLGFNNISTLVMTREELRPLVERGELSEYAVVSRYTEMGRLFAPQVLPPTGIPVLDRVRKSSGEFNWNNQQIVVVSRYYAADGLAVVRHFPASYVIGLIISNRMFFSPSSMNAYFTPANRAAARPMEAIFNPLLYGVPAQPGVALQPHFGFTGAVLEVNTSWLLIGLWLVLIGYGYVQARRAFMGAQEGAMPRAIVLGFIIFSMLYIYGVGTAFELAENYRYRWVVEPLTFVLLATAVTHLIRVVHSRFVVLLPKPADK